MYQIEIYYVEMQDIYIEKDSRITLSTKYSPLELSLPQLGAIA